MKKIITIVVCLLIICTGCSETVDTSVKEDSTLKQTNEEISSNRSIEDTMQNIELDTIEKTSEKSVCQPSTAQEYLDFLGENEYQDIIFFNKSDIDLDGIDEVIIAVGSLGDDSLNTIINELYILKHDNDKIEVLDKISSIGGYSFYEVKLVHLQDMPKEYLYCGITNGVLMFGFGIYEIVDNKANQLCYYASPTGSGFDELVDFDEDGQYDGYVQYRSSYDVLYYSVSRKYMWDNNDFILKDTYVDVQGYPEDIKGVILEYLSLKAIDVEESPQVVERLSDICMNNGSYNTENLGYLAVLNTIMEFDDAMVFEIEEKGDIADVSVTYVDELTSNSYEYIFKLIKVEDKWCIENIESVLE